MEEEVCPICNHTDCDEFIIDLLICNNCSHIFKIKTELEDNGLTKPIHSLHLQKNPVEYVQTSVDELKTDNIMEFNFPCMNFYALDLHPTNFYKSSINHYFNQMSIMILLNRCRLKPIKQQNKWNKDETICITHIVCRKV